MLYCTCWQVQVSESGTACDGISCASAWTPRYWHLSVYLFLFSLNFIGQPADHRPICFYFFLYAINRFFLGPVEKIISIRNPAHGRKRERETVSDSY